MRCGGCQLQHLQYKEQLRFKANVVKDTLRKIAGLSVDVPVAVKSDLPYGYRNKLQLPVGVDKEGKNVVGFYAERSHRIIPSIPVSFIPIGRKKSSRSCIGI